MKSVIVVVCWLLVGFFFWSMAKNCCSTSSSESISTVPVIEDDVALQSSQAITEKDTNVVGSVSEVDSQFVLSSISDSNTNKAFDYDHASYSSITVDGGASVIPLSVDNAFNDEIKAHLEQACSKIKNDFSKIKIQGFNNSGNLASSTAMKMENFLVRCGVSPFRISRTNFNIDSADSHIKMFIID